LALAELLVWSQVMDSNHCRLSRRFYTGAGGLLHSPAWEGRFWCSSVQTSVLVWMKAEVAGDWNLSRCQTMISPFRECGIEP